MDDVDIIMKQVGMISIHYRDGRLKSYIQEDMCHISQDIILNQAFLFAVINISERRSPMVITNLQELFELIYSANKPNTTV